jgi:hypothetical protein
MKNKIEDLRNHLFATLEDLRDKDHPMDLDRAEAVAKVAQVIVNSATLEVKFINAIGGKGSGFIPAGEGLPSPSQPVAKTTVHRLK